MQFSYRIDSSSAVFAQLQTYLERLVRSWEDEHAGYYGRPHGAQTIVHQPGDEMEPAWTTDGVARYRMGYTAAVEGDVDYSVATHQWLACSGNWWKIQRVWNPEGLETLYVQYSGRRHGQVRFSHQLLKWLEVRGQRTRYVSTEAEWPTWSTADSQASDRATWPTEQALLAEDPAVYLDWLQDNLEWAVGTEQEIRVG